MFRGRGVPLSSLTSILSSKQTLSSLLPRKKPYILLSSLPSRGVRSALFEPRMEEEARLFLKTKRDLFGIKLRELMGMGKEEKKEAMDWASLPSPPFDFSVKVPGEEQGFPVYHFVLDSKLYLARGGLASRFDLFEYEDPHFGMSPSCKKKKIRVICSGAFDIEEYEVADGIPWCKIYQLDIDNKKVSEVPADSNSIPPLPTPFYPCFLGNIPGHPDVYCLVYCKSGRPELEGLWVLSSSSSSSTEKRLWKCLPPPPPLLNDRFHPVYRRCFVFQGRLFLSVPEYPLGHKRDVLFSFDPTTAEWARMDYDVMTTFDTLDTWSLVTLSLNNRAVGVTSLAEVDPDDNYYDEPAGPLMAASLSLPAFLVNDENGGPSLRYNRSIHECFNGVRPSVFDAVHNRIKLADLGNGMVCALLYAYTPDHDESDSPVLCISVFNLSIVEPVSGTEALSVEVHAKRAFTMKEHDKSYSSFVEPFVFTPKK